MLKYEHIHGFKVEYESEEKHIREGISYLDNKIEASEAKVFFDQAKAKKSAQFEDKENHQFTLMYKGNSVYLLISRE